MANRLTHEKSPYLLQHAQNPVDWYPWGSEAFEAARRENKPVLVSIGYSTCHWCHVMEHESYENPAIAKLMNEYFINIKVDREERPDVDKLYMTAVSTMTGSGGWPLNAFLTPELKPFFGGTYFPPTSRWGVPAWPDVVSQIGQAWRDPVERQRMLDSAQHITESLRNYVSTSAPPEDFDTSWLDRAFQSLQRAYDAKQGGFNAAPKFPMPVNLNFLLVYYSRTHDDDALTMVTHTLDAMAKGGIYDHLGGGFARYSTDDHWHVPHFEKMLYDNAQLAVNYTEAFQITQDPALARIARETLDYVLRDMTHPGGGFYSAEDADSSPTKGSTEKREGAFYVWEKTEILKALGDRLGEIVCYHYGAQDAGNAGHDPHGEFKNQNILFIAHSLDESAKHAGLSLEETERELQRARKILFALRGQRPRPHLDDKIISAWNGLMISAFAKAYQVFREPKDLQAAQKAAAFLKAHLFDAKSGEVSRSWRDGETRAAGIADDYAFLAQGLIDLYEADFNPDWLAWAQTLTDILVERFYDPDHGGFFMTSTAQDPNLFLRVKEDQDNVEPSASSVAALNLLRLAQFKEREDYQGAAEKTLRGFGRVLREAPRAFPQMLVALHYAASDVLQVVVAKAPGSQDAEPFIKALQRRFIPVKIAMLVEGGIEGMRPLGGKATAYVCRHRACLAPATSVESFERQLSP